MKKFLLLICALVSAFTTAFAETKEVTFDFTNPEGLTPAQEKPENSSGTAVNDVTFSNDGVTILFSKGSASNDCRIFASNKGVIDLRIYKGSTMTITAPTDKYIISVTLEGTKAANVSTEVGTLNNKLWTGSETSVAFTATATEQLNTVTVVYGDKDDAVDVEPAPEATGDGTLENPYNAKAANEAAAALTAGSKSENDVYIKGIISSVKYTYSTQYGTATFNISDSGTDLYPFTIYGVLYLDNTKYTDDTKTNIKVGDQVIVYGKLMNYSGTYETASGEAYLYSLNGTTTGINNVAAPYAANKSIYTLNGCRVAKAVKGINIINGKKVLVK